MKFDGGFRFDQPDGLEVAERALGRTISQLRNAPAVEQLQRLGNELDVADSARIDLHVEGVEIAAPHAVDLFFEGVNPVRHAVVHARVEDRRGCRDDCVPAEIDVSGNRSRLHEGRLLPGVRPGFEVGNQGSLRHHERALDAARDPGREVHHRVQAARVQREEGSVP